MDGSVIELFVLGVACVAFGVLSGWMQ